MHEMSPAAGSLAAALILALGALGAPPALGQDAPASETAPAPAPAPAASGPQQTVEGAQEFLRLITQQFAFASADISNNTFFYRSTGIRFEPAGPCVSRISRNFEWRINDGQSSPDLDPEGNLAALLAHWTRTYPGDTNLATNHKNLSTTLVPAEVNWSSVSSVKTFKSAQTDTGDRGVLVNTQPAFSLIAPDVPTAARVAYAMEFLRSACDVSASTGF